MRSVIRMVTYRDLSYPVSSGSPQRLDVYTPSVAAPEGGRPTIVAIHGGGWRRYSKSDYGPRVASVFVPLGFVVIAPNYELSSPGNSSWPVNIEDVKAAVRWARLNSDRFGINPDRLVAMGESAGGHLSTLLGVSSRLGDSSATSCSVSAVVAFSSPTDLAALHDSSPDARQAVAQFLGGKPGSVPDRYSAASPVDQITTETPPMMLIHGARDTLVPPGQSRELAAALTAAGVPNRLVVIPGVDHRLDFPLRTPKNLATWILAFLHKTWKD